MIRLLPALLLFTLALAELPTAAARHRATRLGNPATRFAPPLESVEDLRDRFRDPKLRPDFAEILRQWGWPGDLEDLFKAALSNEIVPHEIAVGEVMPFMSSRKNGHPVCLEEVLWAGKEPIKAFTFHFTSKGRKYQCITPRPCSNFFVVDRGPADTTLTLECQAPKRQFTGRDIEVCLTVRNTGASIEPDARLRLTLPPGVRLTGTSDQGRQDGNAVLWSLGELPPGTGKKVCAALLAAEPQRLSFAAEVAGNMAPPDACSTETEVLGVYGLLVEVVDLEDPVKAGNEANYVITVTNQGLQRHTNVRIVATLGNHHQLVAADGITQPETSGSTLTFDPLPVLAGKKEVTWKVTTRSNPPADTQGLLDTRFVILVSSDQITNPVREEESTMLHR